MFEGLSKNKDDYNKFYENYSKKILNLEFMKIQQIEQN